ncbi:hypothetical protein WICPIJ_003707 [Wickerhamomyces pijperi]|uniref:Protein kinase domain-containing protein n=1 Tax=Wickerhamomyces pijperi TaxID=599730 RepID=A0A9P8TNN0_WICPI|nr:hypothetical protein WICPIJ_003707 [Wickerhamomyces pijperi]
MNTTIKSNNKDTKASETFNAACHQTKDLGPESGKEATPPTDTSNSPAPPTSFTLITKLDFSDFFQESARLGKGGYGEVVLVKPVAGKHHVKNPTLFSRPNNSLMQWSPNECHDNVYTNAYGVMALNTMQMKPRDIFWNIRDVDFSLSVPYHPNLIHIYEMFISFKDSHLQINIVMECVLQSLKSYLPDSESKTHLSPKDLKSVLRQLLQAIDHIHKSGFVHRDIKADNILLTPISDYFSAEFGSTSPDLISMEDKYALKLADYGVSKRTTEAPPADPYLVGTRPYMAPEILLLDSDHGAPVDIWSFCCVVYELITGSKLFANCWGSKDMVKHMVKKLGTPYDMRQKQAPLGHVPAFGYWHKAKRLMRTSGIKIRKQIYVVSLKPMFKDCYLCGHEDFEPLLDVLRASLRWNPAERATAEHLLNMPYFTS